MPNLDGTGPINCGSMVNRRWNCLRRVFCSFSKLNKEEKIKILKENKEILEKEIEELENEQKL